MLKTAGSTDVLNRAINGIDAKLADNKQNDLCSEQINPSEGFPFDFQKRFKFTRLLLSRLKVGKLRDICYLPLRGQLLSNQSDTIT